MSEHMERRLHPRVQVQFEARVSNLTTGGPSTLGRVVDLSGSGISVILPRELATGDCVQLEMADSKLTGHVIHSRPENSLFRVGIAMERAELGSSSLAELLQRTLLDSMPGVPGVESLETRLC
jgi:hypothetical protein